MPIRIQVWTVGAQPVALRRHGWTASMGKHDRPCAFAVCRESNIDRSAEWRRSDEVLIRAGAKSVVQPKAGA